MTDLEITKACAEAMGYTVCGRIRNDSLLGVWTEEHGHYYPLFSDVQAFALVKKFGLEISPNTVSDEPPYLWCVTWTSNVKDAIDAQASDLNRAICLCVATLKESAR